MEGKLSLESVHFVHQNANKEKEGKVVHTLCLCTILQQNLNKGNGGKVMHYICASLKPSLRQKVL